MLYVGHGDLWLQNTLSGLVFQKCNPAGIRGLTIDKIAQSRKTFSCEQADFAGPAQRYHPAPAQAGCGGMGVAWGHIQTNTAAEKQVSVGETSKGGAIGYVVTSSIIFSRPTCQDW